MRNYMIITLGTSVLRDHQDYSISPDCGADELEGRLPPPGKAGAEISVMNLFSERIVREFHEHFEDNIVRHSFAAALKAAPSDVTLEKLYQAALCEIHRYLPEQKSATVLETARELMTDKVFFAFDRMSTNKQLISIFDSALKSDFTGFELKPVILELHVAFICTENDKDQDSIAIIKRLADRKYVDVDIDGLHYRVQIIFDDIYIAEGLSETENALSINDKGLNNISEYLAARFRAPKESKEARESNRQDSEYDLCVIKKDIIFSEQRTEKNRIIYKQRLNAVCAPIGGYKIIPIWTVLQAQLNKIECVYAAKGNPELTVIPALPIGFKTSKELEFAYELGHPEMAKGEMLKELKRYGLIAQTDGGCKRTGFGALMYADITANSPFIGTQIELKLFRELSMNDDFIRKLTGVTGEIQNKKVENGVEYSIYCERKQTAVFDQLAFVESGDIDELVFYHCGEEKILLAVESKSDSRDDHVIKQGIKNLKFVQAEAKRNKADKVFFILISTVADAGAEFVKEFAKKWTEEIWDSVSNQGFRKKLVVKACAVSLMREGKVEYKNFFTSKNLSPVCLWERSDQNGLKI